MRVPVFTDDPGWHGKRLEHAFAERGYEAIFISLKDCHFDLNQGQAGVVIPGFTQLPQVVFVRGVPGGTVQQVIARLDILHALKLLGIKVYNDGRAIERTVDKAMTSFILHRNSIPTPATWVCESRQQAQSILQREGKLVIKPLFGSQGLGVRMVESDKPFPVPMEQHVEGVYYLQSFVDSGDANSHDYRVFIICNQVIAVMRRSGASWVNNVALGGRCELAYDDEIAAIALRAAEVMEINYCGVDVIRDVVGGCYVLEVNSIPAWKGLQSVVDVDIAQLLVDDFLSE
ncbi:MAG: RimK family alpha-L-glutamate ligase [Methylophilales bacterium]|nr:RimK family alpha-L-glutamate ligase [Methylophilales bacterium]